MIRYCIFIFALLSLPSSALGQRSFARDTLFVSDRFLTSRSTAGAEIIANFGTAEARAATIRLDAPVATLDGRTWILSDILITADFNGNGYVATWKVAGPTPVIERHIAQIREMTKARDLIYDHGIRKLFVKCACD
jgi:hypothetical protein